MSASSAGHAQDLSKQTKLEVTSRAVNSVAAAGQLARLVAKNATSPPLQASIAAFAEYDKTIAETEAAYMKILESSQTLLNVLKRETVNLVKKKQTSS